MPFVAISIPCKWVTWRSVRPVRARECYRYGQPVVCGTLVVEASVSAPANHHAGVSMANMSGVVQQLRREREGLQKQLQRIDAALAALLSANSNGPRRDACPLPLVAESAWRRRRDGQNRERPRRSGRYLRQEEADRGGAESKVGEVEEGGVGEPIRSGTVGGSLSLLLASPPQAAIASAISSRQSRAGRTVPLSVWQVPRRR